MLGRVKFVLGVWMCCSFGIYQATAQQNNASDKTAALNRDQDSLIRISTAVLNATENTVRFEQNALFIKTLVNALKTPGSFNFGFDSLKNVAHVVSPDKAFKIFSWYVPTNEGGYRFFGAIQLNSKDGQLKLFPLIDETGSFKDTNLISDNKKWFGARYYAIVPVVNSGKQTYYGKAIQAKRQRRSLKSFPLTTACQFLARQYLKVSKAHRCRTGSFLSTIN